MNTDSTSIFKLVGEDFTVLLMITVDHNLYIIAKSEINSNFTHYALGIGDNFQGSTRKADQRVQVADKSSLSMGRGGYLGYNTEILAVDYSG